MDWQALLHNKWALGGLAAAAAAGGFVLYKRRAAGGSGGSGSAVDAANSSPAYSGGVGGFDSTGTDVAAWLGSYSGNLQNQLDQFAAQQADFLGALQAMQTTTPATAPTSPIPAALISRNPRWVTPVPPTTTTSALARLARR